MPKGFLLTAQHAAGGLALNKGERNTAPEDNIQSQMMEYVPEGEAVTALGWAVPTGWESVETNHAIDGMFGSQNFPEVIFKAVNGKIKQANSRGNTFYNVDTGLSMTAGNRVLFKEYRGNVYFCNGVDDMGRIAVGKVLTSFSAAATPIVLSYGNGYRFTNGVDKVYIEGDEIDYTAVSTDSLTTVSNNLAHSANAIVTQYNTLTAPGSGSLKAKTMAIFRDTLWYAGPREPNVLRYGETVSSIGTISNIHDFSSGNNYLIGEAGDITALHATRDRLYVFTNDKVYYITIEIDQSGVEVFSVDRLFTPNYGCPNPFCVAEMEDIVVFFTGRRLIRIGYQPNVNQLLPDEKFDEEIFPILATCDEDQSNASLEYDPVTKRLFLTVSIGGVLKTIVYNKRMGKYSYDFVQDPRCYVRYQNRFFFGDRADDKVWQFNLDIDADGSPLPHILKTGRLDNGNRSTKRYIRGMVEGRKTQGSQITFSIKVNGSTVITQTITDDHMGSVPSQGSLGAITVGTETVGGGIGTTEVYPWKFPFVVNCIGEDIQFQWSSFQTGGYWTVAKWQIEGIEYDKVPYTHY